MPQQAVADVKRQAVIDHLLTETAQYVMANGLNVTMSDIAAAVGVSRRSLFRHFGSRERLIADAFARIVADYVLLLPRYEGDLETWLRATCATAHTMNPGLGRGLAELMSNSDLAPEVAAVEEQRRRQVRALFGEIATTAWQAAGGAGAAPAELYASVCAHLSTGFTAAVRIYAGSGTRVAADISYAGIMATLAGCLERGEDGGA